MRGSGAVGKSALTIQFVTKHFVSEYEPTVENSYRREFEIDGKSTVLEILDTGREDLGKLTEQSVKMGDAFVLVYAINNRKSFEDLLHYRQQIVQLKNSHNVPTVVVGNKLDLITSQPGSDENAMRAVTTDEGQELARSFNASFFETSAKTGANVEEAFFQLVRERYFPVPTPILNIRTRKEKTNCVTM